jgi:hypothetical protein
MLSRASIEDQNCWYLIMGEFFTEQSVIAIKIEIGTMMKETTRKTQIAGYSALITDYQAVSHLNTVKASNTVLHLSTIQDKFRIIQTLNTLNRPRARISNGRRMLQVGDLLEKPVHYKTALNPWKTSKMPTKAPSKTISPATPSPSSAAPSPTKSTLTFHSIKTSHANCPHK